MQFFVGIYDSARAKFYVYLVSRIFPQVLLSFHSKYGYLILKDSIGYVITLDNKLERNVLYKTGRKEQQPNGRIKQNK